MHKGHLSCVRRARKRRDIEKQASVKGQPDKIDDLIRIAQEREI